MHIVWLLKRAAFDDSKEHRQDMAYAQVLCGGRRSEGTGERVDLTGSIASPYRCMYIRGYSWTFPNHGVYSQSGHRSRHFQLTPVTG